MTALPSPTSGATFTTEEYRMGLKWWLGAPLIAQTDARCPGCGQQVDPEGDHFVCCARNNFATRHDAVQDAIFTVLSSSGQRVAREVALQSQQDSQLRPADLLVENWHAGQPTAIDVTVVHGWTSAMRLANVNPQPRDTWRKHLCLKEAAKHAKYDAGCEAEGWHFVAAAFGTWGGLGPEGAKALSRIVKRSSTWETADTCGVAQRRMYESVGVALFRRIWQLLAAKNRLP